MQHKAFFVTGTDTGIGKTTVACVIAAAWAEAGLRVGVAKPVETGCEPASDGTLIPADAVRLQYFSRCSERLDSICPYRCLEPLAPAVAIRREGRKIDLLALGETVREIIAHHDVTLVEGAGGLLVPVQGSLTFADLLREWRLPLVVVVGNRLGALNHAQLTINCALSRGLTVAGYIVNELSSQESVASQTNIEAFEYLLGPPLGILPWMGNIECTETDRVHVASVGRQGIDFSRLVQRF